MKTEVDWAILSKFPEDTNDFRVLACSQCELDPNGFHSLIRDWMTGNLPVEPSSNTPPAPWYQFGILQNPLRLVILQQKWTGYSDFKSRPSQMTTCLLIPFEHLAASHCSFKHMSAFFDQPEISTLIAGHTFDIAHRIQNFECEKLPITLPSLDESTHWINHAVDLVGKDNCFQAAKLLLQGPLCLEYIDNDVPSLEERLTWLDAILAMLPYSLRADCPSTLWASISSSHSMRLYWSQSARPGHEHLEIHRNSNGDLEIRLQAGTPVTSKQERYIANLAVYLDRFPVEKILQFIVNKSSPPSFSSPIPDDFFKELDPALDLLNNIRKESHISPESYKTALELLNSNSLGSLRESEQFEFISRLLIPNPGLELGQLQRISSFWNEQLLDFISKTAITTFSMDNPGKSKLLRNCVFLLLINGKSVDLFHTVWNNVMNGHALSLQKRQEDLVIVIQNAFDDWHKGKSLSIDSLERDNPLDPLISWAAKTISSEDILFSWASIIVNNDATFTEPFKMVLNLLSGETSEITNSLKSVWVGSDSQPIDINNIFMINAVDKLVVLVQSAAHNQMLNEVFLPAANKLLVWQNQNILHTSNALTRMLNDPKISSSSLNTKDSALLDELRLSMNIPKLELVELLKAETDHFTQYLNSLTHFIENLDPYRKNLFCGRLYSLVINMFPSEIHGEFFWSNFDSFRESMARITLEETKWQQLTYNRYLPMIKTAIEKNSSPEELAIACKSVLEETHLINENQKIFPNWDWLIGVFAQNHFPTTSKDLWKLEKYLGAYVTDIGQDQVLFELKWHRAVILEKQILNQIEIESYIDCFGRQLFGNVNIYYMTIREMDKFASGKKWNRQIREAMNFIKKNFPFIF